MGSVSPALELGDQITLAGTERLVTEFLFGYAGNFIQDGDESAVIRFYANDGPGGEPGSLLFVSRTIGLIPSALSGRDVTLTGLSVLVPTTFTWTIDVTGLLQSGLDQAGPTYANPPTIGS